ncbi:hypothetical protein BAE44_0000087, partial [Dichanthelium oligosanthes]
LPLRCVWKSSTRVFHRKPARNFINNRPTIRTTR